MHNVTDLRIYPNIVREQSSLYWFTAIGSETIFYFNKFYKLPDWLLPDPTAISCQNLQIPSVFPDPTAISCQNLQIPSVLSCDQSASIVSFSFSISLEHVKAINHREIACAYSFLNRMNLSSTWTAALYFYMLACGLPVK